MKKLIFILITLVSGVGFAQVPVNIVYPINGGSYPVVSPGGVGSEYVTFSFGVTCPGGPYTVKWGSDATAYGNAQYYDQYSTQQVYKLPSGGHVFWVRTDCGQDRVYFRVK